jgi:hypothetical protein
VTRGFAPETEPDAQSSGTYRPFRKVEGVGEAFDIKAHHDVYKDPSVKGLSFKIHGLAKKLGNLPVVKRAARRHFFFDDDGSDGDDRSHGDDSSHGGDDD